jgi:hypothetical protein
VWELRDGRLIDFAGPFTEWEAMMAQRRADAADSAKQSRQQQAAVASPSAHDTRKAQSKEERRVQRDAVRAVESAEAAVVKAEAEVGRLAHALEDPALYDGSAESTAKAQRLGAELAKARAVLANAETEWTTASEAAEALGAL